VRHKNVSTTKTMINDLNHVWDDVSAFGQDRGPGGTALIEGMERVGVLAPAPSSAWVLFVCVILFACTGVVMACVASAREKKNAIGSDEYVMCHKNIPLAPPRLHPHGAWVPVGSDGSKATRTRQCTRSSVVLSSDGSVVAAGIPDQGCIRVWQYSPETHGWIQRGQDIPRLENPSWKNVAMSGDGRVLAIGDPIIHESGCRYGARVRVYRWDPVVLLWNPGVEIFGRACDEFGGNVAMSSDGTVVAVTSLRAVDEWGLGNVRVFRINLEEQSWAQLGQDIYGSYGVGDDVAISNDGRTVATGAVKHSGWRGQVLVWTYNDEEGQWSGFGQALDGQHRDWAGHVSLSGDGGILAIGAPVNEDFGVLSGQVRVWQFDTKTQKWIKLGQTLYGQDEGEELGLSVALSMDGMTLAVGVDGTEAKFVRVYQFHPLSAFWVQLGEVLCAEVQGKDTVGIAVALSSDGKTCACGAFLGNGTDRDRGGFVRVFKYEPGAPSD
jgi:WD40 repeat protein